EVPILEEIVIIFALSIGVLLICHRLRLPAVVGFLATGVLCGPHGLALVKGIEDVQILATIGIVLLLFTVGMEFSLQKIIKYKYYFLVGGFLQVFLTTSVCFFVSKLIYGSTWGAAVFLGFLISLSSTAIVLRLLDERGDSDTPHGRLVVGILIFQDIIAVPMMLLIPLLAGASEGFDSAHLLIFIKGISVLSLMSYAAFKLVPKLLYYVARTRNRELFLLTVLTTCFAIAWITSSVGLSLSLGAFLAGLIVSESEYSDEALGNVLPFQEIFTSFFFVSMGMLLDISFVAHQPIYIALITILVVILKAVMAGSGAIVLGMPLRSAILAGVAVSQVGEFSFVLALSGMHAGLASEYYYQLFLAVSLLTMSITPLLISLSNRLAQTVDQLPLPQKIKTGYNFFPEEAGNHQKKDHIVIIGFGLRGKHLARAAKEAAIPYEILEMNTDTVKMEKSRGEPIHYGDASHRSVLSHCGIKTARVLAVVINDPVASLRIVQIAKDLNPNIYVITRTRYFQEVPPMFQAGASDVIPDEFGSSLEIFSRVLEKCEVAQELIFKLTRDLRIEGYETLHWHSSDEAARQENQLDLKQSHIHTFQVSANSSFVGKTIVDNAFRNKHGLTILQIRRSGNTLNSVEPSTKIEVADTLIVVGSPDQLKMAQNLF
ncbi:MAG: cation:proton antiporter, partial [Parachlamydiaceae bacterium]|nr:cation:proton antiporter [Parachlamydiaceae bacterium]